MLNMDQAIALKLGAEAGVCSHFTTVDDCPLRREDLKVAWCMGLALQYEKDVVVHRLFASNMVNFGINHAIIECMEEWTSRSQMVRDALPFMKWNYKAKTFGC